MTTIQVSLTRAHKIAERLKAHATELLSNSMVSGSPTLINGRAAAQLERMGASGIKAVADFEKAERVLRACANVRTVIARENQSRGISAKLAELDAVNKLVAQAKSLHESFGSAQIELNEVATYQPLGNEGSYQSGLRVNVVEPASRDSLQQHLRRLQREAVQLSDAVAEANAARVELVLDDDLAAIATGLEA